MSCYVCKNETISVIAGFLAQIGDGSELGHLQYCLQKWGVVISRPIELGQELFGLNCFSVDERYGPGQWKEFTGGSGYVYTEPAALPTIYEVIKALSCYLYQSCEGDAAKSPLYNAMQFLRGELSYHIVARSAAYESAKAV